MGGADPISDIEGPTLVDSAILHGGSLSARCTNLLIWEWPSGGETWLARRARGTGCFSLGRDSVLSFAHGGCHEAIGPTAGPRDLRVLPRRWVCSSFDFFKGHHFDSVGRAGAWALGLREATHPPRRSSAGSKRQFGGEAWQVHLGPSP